MNLTKKDFIKNSQNPELTQAVLNQIGVDWEQLTDYPEDYANASNGVSGFIYYYETVAFAKDNLVLIMNALNKFENETGAPLNKPTDDETQFYNWMAWFALESVIFELIRFKEDSENG